MDGLRAEDLVFVVAAAAAAVVVTLTVARPLRVEDAPGAGAT